MAPIPSRGRLFPLLACAVFLASLLSAAHAAEAVSPEAAELVQRLEELHPQVEGKEDAGDARVQHEECRKKLLSLGPDALPAIQERLANPEGPAFRRGLAFLLGEIPGEASDRALVQLVCTDQAPVSTTALFQLLHRADQSGPLTFPLTDEELGVLVDAVNRPETHPGGGMVVRLLGLCAKNDVRTRFDPILARFIRDIRYTGEYPKVMGSYVSPRVYTLNGHLLAFGQMGDTSWAPLRAAIQEARSRGETEVEKWLCIAAGYACDPEAADALKPVVLSDPDRYVRLVAIRAYSRSAGQKAVPVLESLLDDPTVGEYDVHPFMEPHLIVAQTAREELHKLANPDTYGDRCVCSSAPQHSPEKGGAAVLREDGSK